MAMNISFDNHSHLRKSELQKLLRDAGRDDNGEISDLLAKLTVHEMGVPESTARFGDIVEQGAAYWCLTRTKLQRQALDFGLDPKSTKALLVPQLLVHKFHDVIQPHIASDGTASKTCETMRTLQTTTIEALDDIQQNLRDQVASPQILARAKADLELIITFISGVKVERAQQLNANTPSHSAQARSVEARSRSRATVQRNDTRTFHTTRSPSLIDAPNPPAAEIDYPLLQPQGLTDAATTASVPRVSQMTSPISNSSRLYARSLNPENLASLGRVTRLYSDAPRPMSEGNPTLRMPGGIYGSVRDPTEPTSPRTRPGTGSTGPQNNNLPMSEVERSQVAMDDLISMDAPVIRQQRPEVRVARSSLDTDSLRHLLTPLTMVLPKKVGPGPDFTGKLVFSNPGTQPVQTQRDPSPLADDQSSTSLTSQSSSNNMESTIEMINEIDTASSARGGSPSSSVTVRVRSHRGADGEGDASVSGSPSPAVTVRAGSDHRGADHRVAPSTIGIPTMVTESEDEDRLSIIQDILQPLLGPIAGDVERTERLLLTGQSLYNFSRHPSGKRCKNALAAGRYKHFAHAMTLHRRIATQFSPGANFPSEWVIDGSQATKALHWFRKEIEALMALAAREDGDQADDQT